MCQDISGTFRVFSSMNIEGSEKKHALQRKICLNTAQSCTILHTELCIRIEKVCAIPISGARLQSWKSSKAPVHLCQVWKACRRRGDSTSSRQPGDVKKLSQLKPDGLRHYQTLPHNVVVFLRLLQIHHWVASAIPVATVQIVK